MCEKRIRKETIDKLILRQQRPDTNIGAHYMSYGHDDKYVAFIDTKNKQYLFIKDCFEKDKYLLLKAYDKKKPYVLKHVAQDNRENARDNK